MRAQIQISSWRPNSQSKHHNDNRPRIPDKDNKHPGHKRIQTTAIYKHTYHKPPTHNTPPPPLRSSTAWEIRNEEHTFDVTKLFLFYSRKLNREKVEGISSTSPQWRARSRGDQPDRFSQEGPSSCQRSQWQSVSRRVPIPACFNDGPLIVCEQIQRVGRGNSRGALQDYGAHVVGDASTHA